MTGPAAFARQVTLAADVPRTPELVRRRRAVAARHSWAARALRMAALVGLPIEVTATNQPAGPMEKASDSRTDTPRRAG